MRWESTFPDKNYGKKKSDVKEILTRLFIYFFLFIRKWNICGRREINESRRRWSKNGK